jgi:hypothetical protein
MARVYLWMLYAPLLCTKTITICVLVNYTIFVFQATDNRCGRILPLAGGPENLQGNLPVGIHSYTTGTDDARQERH